MEKRKVFKLPDEHLKAIGSIIVSFASLENAVETAIWALMGIDSTKGAIVTSEMSFKNLLALFSSLYLNKINAPDEIEEMKALIKRSTQIEDRRNAVVHSLWGVRYYKHGQIVVRMKTTAKVSKGLKRQDEELSVEALESIYEEIVEVIAAWTSFLYKKLMPKSELPDPV
jgi:hypothetical protein